MQPKDFLGYSLFKGFSADEVQRLISVLEPSERSHPKGNIIISEGERNYFIRILASGSAYAYKNALGGELNVYTDISAGNVFGGVLAAAGGIPSEVSVVAVENCTVYMFDYRRITAASAAEPELRIRLLAAINAETAKKYFALRARVDCLTKSTLRDKILTYLKLSASRQGTNTVYVPFNRERLASYLCADRTALSRELSRMRGDGIIEFWKNTFKLLNTSDDA